MRALKRIRALANEILCKDGVVADVGADHGFLCKLLIEEGRAKKTIATDISEKSLQKTKDLAKKYNLENFVQTRVGDGLTPLNENEANVIVVAGMGGYEIAKIISDAKLEVYKNASLVLQPVQNAKELRLYLNKNGFIIYKDFVVKDKNKFYNIIVTKYENKKQNLSEDELEFGLTNFDLHSQDFVEELEQYILRYEAVLNENPQCLKAKQKIEHAKSILANTILKRKGE